MKISILFLCVIIAGGTLAAKPDTSKTVVREGFEKKYGKIWYIKFLPDSMPLDNGMMVYVNGTLKTPEGKIYRFVNGERTDFEGAVESMDQRIDQERGMVVMNNNYMWIWSVLDKPAKLKNGSYILPDGTLKQRSGKYVLIKDESFVDFDGNVSMPAKEKEQLSEK